MAPKDRVKILLVDDQPRNLMSLEAALQDPGLMIFKARSGKEALKHVLEHDFAVILLDVQMPQMDGFETAGLIRKRERSRRTPIIFITAVGKDESHVSRGYSLGAVDYLFKPVVVEILRAKVAGFVELFRKTAEVERQREQLARSNTALQKSNAELAASRASLAAILDSTVDAILTVNKRGVIEAVNRRTRELFGYEEKELLGQGLEVLLPGSQLEAAVCCHDQPANARTTLFHPERGGG